MIFRHGVPGGAHGGPRPRDDGARRRQGSHHNILLMRWTDGGAGTAEHFRGQRLDGTFSGSGKDVYQIKEDLGEKELCRFHYQVIAKRRTVSRLSQSQVSPAPRPRRLGTGPLARLGLAILVTTRKWCSDEITEDMNKRDLSRGRSL